MQSGIEKDWQNNAVPKSKQVGMVTHCMDTNCNAEQRALNLKKHSATLLAANWRCLLLGNILKLLCLQLTRFSCWSSQKPVLSLCSDTSQAKLAKSISETPALWLRYHQIWSQLKYNSSKLHHNYVGPALLPNSTTLEQNSFTNKSLISIRGADRAFYLPPFTGHIFCNRN